MKSPMERRLDLGLKQRDVAKVAKVANSSVSRLERNLPMHQSTRLLILRALEALETEQLTKMCAEDGKPTREKYVARKPDLPGREPLLPPYEVMRAMAKELDEVCPPCHGTGIVWSPDGKPWKCPYCGEAT